MPVTPKVIFNLPFSYTKSMSADHVIIEYAADDAYSLKWDKNVNFLV